MIKIQATIGMWKFHICTRHGSALKSLADGLISLFLPQFTEEKLGQAEKTELDTHLENLIARGDCTKNWTEKILRQTEVLLQPNPSKRTFSLITVPVRTTRFNNPRHATLQ